MKNVVFFIMIQLILSASICSLISAESINVNEEPLFLTNDESILYVGGNGPNNYSKIQNAINNASKNDIVFVYSISSPYEENLIVDKSIHLLGENKETTIIDGNENGNVILLLSDNINISGFTIKNGGLEFPNGGIIVKSNNNTIINNNLIDNYYGIIMLYSNYNKIIDNQVIDNNQCGIYLESCSHNIITNNYIDGQPFNGIGLWNSSNNNLMSKNTIINNGYTGIRMLSTENNIVTMNTIIENSVGIRVEFSPNTLVIKNNFIKNKGLEALFYGDIFFKNNYTFTNNFWNRPQILPKVIPGLLGKPTPFIPWIIIDLHPSRQMIEIP